MIVNGEALNELGEIDSNSIDLVLTDPPYGYSFMGKDWDKAVPGIEIWSECLRVLKPGAFCLVMSAPRQDVLSRMMVNLEAAGFDTSFTSIYWAYASGFPKASNIGKMVDKRFGAEREVVGENPNNRKNRTKEDGIVLQAYRDRGVIDIPEAPQAKALEGSYAGFQPKPAVEVILVAMKPITEPSYVDQAMKNGKGITWLDDCRIPYDSKEDKENTDRVGIRSDKFNVFSQKGRIQYTPSHGRFPANLLVSDDVLNDGKTTKSTGGLGDINVETIFGQTSNRTHKPFNYQDEGSFSRYFDLDAWNAQFLMVPKASKGEKNRGLYGFEGKHTPTMRNNIGGNTHNEENPRLKQNIHPTVKPLKLMNYLITMFSRKGDRILDPFVGSGTTCIAAEELDRDNIGIERNGEYCAIANARLQAVNGQLEMFS